MFSILRTILIVGVIFYYSPVRQENVPPPSLDGVLGWSKDTAETQPDPSPGHLETVWRALPEGAKQAVVDKILAGSGLGSKGTDTLLPTDRQLTTQAKGQ